MSMQYKRKVHEHEKTAERKQAYLDVWLTADTVYTIIEACKLAGISKPSYYRWLTEDPEFKQLAKEAESWGRQQSIDSVRAQAFKLANDGSERMVCYILDRLDPEFAPKIFSKQQIEGELTLKGVREKADEHS